MDFSVVIPTYNRAGLLEKTIQAWLDQKVDGLTYEVIFVSNGSTDHSTEILQAAEKNNPGRIRFYYIDPTGGPSAPRNRGIREAKSDLVVITDDDVLPDPDLVQSYYDFHQKHSEPNVAALGEVYVPEDVLKDPISKFHEFPFDEVRSLDKLTYLHFWTCNVSFKRSFMLERGMFDESFLYYEDIQVGHKLMDAGMELIFCPEARGQHLHQLKAEGIPAKGEFTGRWLFAFLQQYPDPEAYKRFGVLSKKHLPTLMFLKRCLNRVFMGAVSLPPCMALFKLLGGGAETRSSMTDLYYYIIFRKNMLAGYAMAKREFVASQAKDGRITENAWVDRGES